MAQSPIMLFNFTFTRLILYRTAHDDHWAFVSSPENSVPKENNQNPETRPLVRDGGSRKGGSVGHRNYHLEEADRDDRRKSSMIEKNQFPTDTNDAVGKYK